jgi:hypothetical protein
MLRLGSLFATRRQVETTVVVYYRAAIDIVQPKISFGGATMKLLPVLCATIMTITVPALAAPATKPTAAKTKPCPKGQVATTSKVTGEQACFSMTVRPMGQPQALPAPATQAKKP